MSGFKYKINAEELVQLQEYFLRLPGLAEDVVNDVVHNDIAKQAIQAMIKFTPVSKVNKKHAKDSNPYKSYPINLGFYVEEKIDYLVYPELGIGQPEQAFMVRGFNAFAPGFVDKIINALITELNE